MTPSIRLLTFFNCRYKQYLKENQHLSFALQATISVSYVNNRAY